MDANNGNSPVNERRRNTVWLITGLLLAVALLLAADREADRRERVQMDSFRDGVADLARISESILVGQLRDFDNSLLVLRSVYGADPKRFIESIKLLRNGALADRTLLVVLVDRDGYLAYTDAPDGKPRLYLGDRPYFRYFADGGKDRLYVDKPALGRVTGRYTLPLARPVFDGQGGFHGVVAISVLQQSLAGFASRLGLSGDTTIEVINHDGAIVSSSRDLDIAHGTKIRPELLAPILEGAEGVFSSRSTHNDVERIIAYRHIHSPDTPLIVYAKASPGNVLHDTSMQRTMLLWGAGFISLIIMVLIGLYLKGRKVSALLIDTLRKSKEQEYKAITQASLDGFFIVDGSGRFLDLNDVFCRMLGYSRDELLGLGIPDIEAVESPEEVAAHMHKIRQEGNDRFLSRHRRMDGTVIDVEISAQHLKQQDGLLFVFVRDITVQKRAEEGLRESEYRFRALYENAPVLIDGFDKNDGRCILWNKECEKVFGWTINEINSHDEPLALFYPDPNVRKQVVDSVTSMPEKIFREWHPLTRDGKELTALWANFQLPNGMIINIGLDITDHKRAEETLRVSEERYRRLADNFPNGTVTVFDKDLRLTFVAGSDIEKYGAKTEDFIGKHFTELAPPETFAIAEVHIRSAFEGQTSMYETPYWEGRFYYVSVAPLHDMNGRVNEILVVSQNITERKRAEEQLVQSHDLLVNLARLVPGVIYQYRLYPDGRSAFPYSSPGMNDIYEVTPEDVREDATPVFGRLHPDDYDHIVDSIQESARTLQTFYCEFRVILPRQGLRWRWSQAHPERLGDGGTLWHGIISDITERKRADEALQASQEQMRALAGRLQEVREEERTRIAREIHDELGGALTGMKIDFSLLARTALRVENETVRTSLLAGMDSMIETTEATIQTVRRIAMELRPGILDDLGLTAALEWQLKDFEKRTGIRCEFSLPMDDISLDADLSTALFRIFQEALTNVARHSRATEVRGLLCFDAGLVILEVDDNGKGIEKEDALSSMSLGLLGMSERAQIFGGRITVTGTPGTGTKVKVEIPLTACRQRWM